MAWVEKNTSQMPSVVVGRSATDIPLKALPTLNIRPKTEILRGILKKCVTSQAVYPLSEQHGLKARERRYTAHEEGKHWE